MDVLTAYSNRPDLCEKLASTAQQLQSGSDDQGKRYSVCSEQTQQRPWRVTDRLTDEDIRKLVSSYAEGSTIRGLAEQYSVGRSSIKKLLREGGAVRKHGRQA